MDEEEIIAFIKDPKRLDEIAQAAKIEKISPIEWIKESISGSLIMQKRRDLAAERSLNRKKAKKNMDEKQFSTP